MESVNAEVGVNLAQGGDQLTAQTATYDLAQKTIQFRGGARWNLGTQSGEARSVELSPNDGVFRASGRVKMQLPRPKGDGRFLLPPASGEVAKNEPSGEPLLVVCDSFEYRQAVGSVGLDSATFTGNVVLSGDEGLRVLAQNVVVGIDSEGAGLVSLDASGDLDVSTTGENAMRYVGDRLVYSTADETMRLTGKPSVEIRTRLEGAEVVALGQAAIYNLGTGLLRLTGDPVLKTDEGELRGREVVFNPHQAAQGYRPLEDDAESEDDCKNARANEKTGRDETMSLLEAKGLAKAYKKRRVVNGVTFSVSPGEIVGLLGPNGAGKTTSFNMIVGLVKPDEGEVVFEGKSIGNLPMHQRARLGIGYLTQEPSVFRKLTVEQNILAILEVCTSDKLEQKARLKSLLEELDLTPLARSKAYTLSGGEKRRLEITRALVTSPRMLLLDEPFSGIDPIAVYEVQKILRKLKERRMGILITDHNVRETLKLVDRAYIIHKGDVRCEGKAEFLVDDPVAREVYLGPEFNL